MDVRIFARWLNGDGTEVPLHNDVPLSEAIAVRELSGIGRLTGELPPEFLRETASDGRPVIQEWATALFVEVDGIIWDGYIVSDVVDDGDVAEIDCVGFMGLYSGQPYTGVYNTGPVSARSVIGLLVQHLADKRGGNLGLERVWAGEWRSIGAPSPADVPAIPSAPPALAKFTEKAPTYPKYPTDPTTANKKQYETDKKKYDKDLKAYQSRQEEHRALERLRDRKKSERDAAIKERDRVIEDAKIKLNWWSTTDLLREIQDLSATVPFEFRVSHDWVGDNVRHILTMGSPGIRRRRHDVWFMEGENVMALTGHSRYGADKATEVRILGRGEGKDTVIASAADPAGGRAGLSRVRTITAKSKYNKTVMRTEAQSILDHYRKPYEIDSIKVVDTDLAPIHSYDVGDEVRYQTEGRRGMDIDVWVTITEIEMDLEKDVIQLRVEPAAGVYAESLE